MKYDIRFAEKDLANFFQTNIFSLTNDFKKIGIKMFADKKYIAEEIASEIYRGFNRPSCVELYSKKIDDINDIKIIMAKIRVAYGNKGKSSGLICITLVDQKRKIGILFHIYAKNKKNEMTTVEYNSIENILKEYMETF